MDEQTLFLKMADRWREAASEVQNPTLYACYARRAARYQELASACTRQQQAHNKQ